MVINFIIVIIEISTQYQFLYVNLQDVLFLFHEQKTFSSQIFKSTQSLHIMRYTILEVHRKMVELK